MTEITTDSTNDSPATGNAAAGRLDAVFSKLSRFQRPAVCIVILAQLAVLCGMIVMQMIPLASGTVVWLKVIPVDPRDMFRGDYVILSYDMSRPSTEMMASPQPGEPTLANEIYVTLVPDADGKHHRADQYLRERPLSGLYITGRQTSWGRIEYGIESFYVQEGTGLKYEEAVRTGTLSAEVAISSQGQAGLKSLQINR